MLAASFDWTLNVVVMTTIYWRETALVTAERYNIKSRIRLNRERQWSHLIVIAENRIDFRSIR